MNPLADSSSDAFVARLSYVESKCDELAASLALNFPGGSETLARLRGVLRAFLEDDAMLHSMYVYALFLHCAASKCRNYVNIYTYANMKYKCYIFYSEENLSVTGAPVSVFW